MKIWLEELKVKLICGQGLRKTSSHINCLNELYSGPAHDSEAATGGVL